MIISGHSEVYIGADSILKAQRLLNFELHDIRASALRLSENLQKNL
jgi:hypothetical protein